MRKLKKDKKEIIYTKQQYDTDLKNTQQLLQNGSLDYSAFKRLMIHDLCYNSRILETNFVGNYRLEDIEQALLYPNSYNDILCNVSEFLMRISPIYQSLNNYYSNMAMFNWCLDTYDIDVNVDKNKFRKSYFALASQLEKMNLKHEFSKIMKVLPYKDIFYGLIFENKDDFFIQEISKDICGLCSIEDGLYNFRINLAKINPTKLNAYPVSVQEAYTNFIKGKNSQDDNRILQWYYPPSDEQICIKLNANVTYCYPLFIAISRDLFNLNIYKQLKLQSARTDNYKALVIQVPIDSTTVDKPLLSADLLATFSELNSANLPNDIGLLYTLGEPQSMSFKDGSNVRNNVADATNDIYNSAGVAQSLFNTTSSGSSTLLSITNDSGIIYSVYRQFERYLNRYIKRKKYNKTYCKFAVSFIDMISYNRDDVIKLYENAAQYGLPVKRKLMASLGETPSVIEGGIYLENEILDWNNKWIPLKSSHTQSSEETNTGRPTQKIVDTSGEQTRENESNDKR